jgi:hypothetical protein
VVGKSNVVQSSLRQNEYTELGWEVAYTHLKVKYLLHKGLIDENTTIATNPGREFLYNKVFKTVITDYPISKNGVLDLADELQLFCSQSRPQKYLDFQSPKRKCIGKQDFDSTYSLRETINLPKIERDKNYICVTYRKRVWGSHRNVDDHYVNALKKLTTKYKVYVVGLGAEEICDGQAIVYKPLDEWLALAIDERCNALVGSATGPMLLAWTLSGKKIYLVDIDNCLSKTDCCLHFRNENNFYNSHIVQSFNENKRLYYYIIANLTDVN